MEDRELEELRMHGQVITGEAASSPLLQIREKELEIRGRVMGAQKEAEQLVADARGRTAGMLEEASREAEREATELYKAKLDAIDDEAAELATSQDKEIAEMIKGAKGRVEKAVADVLDAVIP